MDDVHVPQNSKLEDLQEVVTILIFWSAALINSWCKEVWHWFSYGRPGGWEGLRKPNLPVFIVALAGALVLLVGLAGVGQLVAWLTEPLHLPLGIVLLMMGGSVVGHIILTFVYGVLLFYYDGDNPANSLWGDG